MTVPGIAVICISFPAWNRNALVQNHRTLKQHWTKIKMKWIEQAQLSQYIQ